MPNYFEFEVTLRDIRPRIWRRFLLPASATFQDLHDAIQDAGPWEDYHLWEFSTIGRRGTTLAAPSGETDEWTGRKLPGAKKAKLADHFAVKGTKCLYTYDFGDSWEHEVKLRKAVELPEKFKRRLLAGERAFPPEDCGSVWGYEECPAAAGAITRERWPDMPDEDQLKERREWLGDWTPEWDLEAAKKRFDR